MQRDDGYTALMLAAEQGRAECVETLAPLENGRKNVYGWTALMYSAENGHLECIKILAPLEKGMKNKKGLTAKSIASYNNRKDCADYLSQFPEELCCKDLFEAAQKGCETCCQKFIS